MKKQREATIDLTDCKYYHDLHERIRIAFNFPQGYGKNWGAFYDSLSFDTYVRKVTIVGEHTVSKSLQSSLETMHEILDCVKTEYENHHYGTFTWEVID